MNKKSITIFFLGIYINYTYTSYIITYILYILYIPHKFYIILKLFISILYVTFYGKYIIKEIT